MKKTEIVERVAGEAGIGKQAAVGAVFASIAEALARSEDLSVVGFGKFSRIDRPAREGRNPRTGERIAIGRRFVQGRQAAEGRVELTVAACANPLPERTNEACGVPRVVLIDRWLKQKRVTKTR